MFIFLWHMIHACTYFISWCQEKNGVRTCKSVILNHLILNEYIFFRCAFLSENFNVSTIFSNVFSEIEITKISTGTNLSIISNLKLETKVKFFIKFKDSSFCFTFGVHCIMKYIRNILIALARMWIFI